jgi:hypothetical protein
MSDPQLKIRPDDTDCMHELDGPTRRIENRIQVGRCSLCGYHVAEPIDSDGSPTGVSLLVERGYWEYLTSTGGTQSLGRRSGTYSAAYFSRASAGGVVNQTYLVMLKPPNKAVQQVIAATVEFHGEHLAFLTAEGELAALFLLDIVQSWNVLSGR